MKKDNIAFVIGILIILLFPLLLCVVWCEYNKLYFYFKLLITDMILILATMILYKVVAKSKTMKK